MHRSHDPHARVLEPVTQREAPHLSAWVVPAGRRYVDRWVGRWVSLTGRHVRTRASPVRGGRS